MLHKSLTADIKIPTEPARVTPQETDNKSERKSTSSASSSYDVIVSKNLFHPSRSMNKKPAEAAQPVSKNELPQLFGTIILKDKKLAILEDKSTKKSTLYKIDESVSGFVIAQILENKVVLQKDGELIEVNLREDKKFIPPTPSKASQTAIRKAQNLRTRANRVRRNMSQRRRTPARSIRRR